MNTDRKGKVSGVEWVVRKECLNGSAPQERNIEKHHNLPVVMVTLTDEVRVAWPAIRERSWQSPI